MIYNRFRDLQISSLGMGNMRLPVLPGSGGIDKVKAFEIIDNAYKNGVNYFDTAFRYHNGESEEFIGEALSRYPRESFYLATKIPGHMMTYKEGKLGFVGYLSGEKIESIEQIFHEQLTKCRVDYFDFYLIHNLCETSFDFYTDDDLRVVEYFLEQKKAGRIKYLGFSTHGRVETIEKFLDKYDCMDFAQIQLNYLDWKIQDADKKYELLTERGIPVIVMEPCRGGKLASFDDEINKEILAVRPNESIASLAFRFAKSLPNVLTVLSGMTNMDQLTDNLKTFSDSSPLSGIERKIIQNVVSKLVQSVPCTSCRYCTEECPQNLDIPKLISVYNEMTYDHSILMTFTVSGFKENEMPKNCVSCSGCSKLCPQNIDIPDILSKLSGMIEKYKKK